MDVVAGCSERREGTWIIPELVACYEKLHAMGWAHSLEVWNTDSGAFQDVVPSLSLRENERGAQTGAGWNPTWHTPLDVWTTFTDKDFRLGLNAAQTTFSAIAQLTGMTITK